MQKKVQETLVTTHHGKMSAYLISRACCVSCVCWRGILWFWRWMTSKLIEQVKDLSIETFGLFFNVMREKNWFFVTRSGFLLCYHLCHPFLFCVCRERERKDKMGRGGGGEGEIGSVEQEDTQLNRRENKLANLTSVSSMSVSKVVISTSVNICSSIEMFFIRARKSWETLRELLRRSKSFGRISISLTLLKTALDALFSSLNLLLYTCRHTHACNIIAEQC